MLSEELGFVGVMIVIALFSVLFFRSMKIAAQAEAVGNYFAAYMAYGIGIWLSMQAIINMAVNVGLLPTKGLTLPLMSYGGSSLIVCCMAIGLLLRINYETSGAVKQARKQSGRKQNGRKSSRKAAAKFKRGALL